MSVKLVEGKNIGSLPDPFPFLSNNKIIKVRSDRDVNSEYLDLYKKMEESLNKLKEVKVNDVVSGVVVAINNKEIFVDFGNKDYIYVDKPKSSTILTEIKVGDEIDVLITKVSNNPYIVRGSITELIKMNVHGKMKNYFDNNIPLIATVKSLIPAGYTLDIHMDNVTVEAFMPNTLADVNRLVDYQSILGLTFEVMLETLQQEQGVYVVSRRKYLQTLIPTEVKKLKYETVYTGEVTGTTPFGVFVQFRATSDGPNCLTGMVHKANISDGWQDKWNQIVPGMEIDFYVKEIIGKYSNYKIILTQKLEESLWDTINVGKVLNGVVKDVKNFGALISLDNETLGLIQINYINKYNKKINIGDELKVKVISLSREDRKIYLNFADKQKGIE